MKPDQKFTPKYWVGHNKKHDDVYPYSLAKSKETACNYMEELLGEDWSLDDDFDIILVEIKMVKQDD